MPILMIFNGILLSDAHKSGQSRCYGQDRNHKSKGRCEGTHFAPCMYDDVKEILNLYATTKDTNEKLKRRDTNEKLKRVNAHVVWLVLQRSDIVTGLCNHGHIKLVEYFFVAIKHVCILLLVVM